MAVYIVTYDLNKETVRPNITGEVKKTAWAQLSESSYAIETSETPEGVYNRFAPMLDDNDNLYVVTMKQPYFGKGPQEVHDWLEGKLTW